MTQGKKFLGQACNIAIQETAFSNNFIASANFKSLLDRICSRFTPELSVVTSRPGEVGGAGLEISVLFF